MAVVHHTHMVKIAGKRHYLREWRKHRGFTLEQVAAEVGTTHATLSRIERGKISYTQPMLEALAMLYRCAPADLLRDPEADEPIWSVWEQIAIDQQPQAIKVLKTFKKVG